MAAPSHTYKIKYKADKSSAVVKVWSDEQRLEFVRYKRGKPIANAYTFNECVATKAKKDKLNCKFETQTTPPVKKELIFEDEAKRDEFSDMVSPEVAINTDAAEALGGMDLGEDPSKSKGKGGIFGFARGLVSKKKIRFQKDGFDLDLTVVTPRIIAMGFPSEGVEAKYRNPKEEVERYFDHYHPDSYKVYNLCSERTYGDIRKIFLRGRLARYPFDDHTPPPFDLFLEFCKDMAEWFAENPKHVVAVHCKAGKGRTGTVIAAFLVYAKFVNNADDGLKYFAQKRTHNAKGVTIPSQIRYVHYFDRYLKECWSNGTEPQQLPASPVLLQAVRIITVPRVEGGGISPFLQIDVPKFKLHNGVPTHFEEFVTAEIVPTKEEGRPGYYNNEKEIVIEVNKVIDGDIKLLIKDAGKNGSGKAKVCHFCFHTYFLKGASSLTLPKMQIDKARKDKTCAVFKKKFAVVLEYQVIKKKPADPQAADAAPAPAAAAAEAAAPPPPATALSLAPPAQPRNRKMSTMALQCGVGSARTQEDLALSLPPPTLPDSMPSDSDEEGQEEKGGDILEEDEDDSSSDDDDQAVVLGDSDEEDDGPWPRAKKEQFCRMQFGQWPKEELEELAAVITAMAASK